MRRSRPANPVVQSIITHVQSLRADRRQVLRGAAFGAAALGATSLAACSSSPTAGDGSGGTVRWGNWTYYLDYDEDTGDYLTLNEFMERTNITVEYYEDVDDNMMFIGKIKDQLALEQDTGYDTFTLTDSSLVRLFEQDQLRPFDRSAMPNVSANMIDMVQHASFDPDREFTIPYQAGMTGLVFNKQLYPQGIRSVSDLWNPDLRGRVNLLSEQADTVALVMLEQGVDISADWGDDEFYTALEVVEEHITSGQVATVKGNSYTQDLQTENVIAGMAWSGDVAMLNDEAGEDIWEFVIPEEGASLFIDSFAMPIATEAQDQVQQLIDFYYEPDIAAEVAAYVQYVSPVEGAREAMMEIDPELAENPLLFPDEEMSAKVFNPRSLSAAEDNTYAQAYQRVLGN